MAGWISVHRQLQNHLLWKDKPFAKGQAWIDLLLLAGYEDKSVLSKGETVGLKRGSFLTSDRDLEDRWGWNRKKVRNFLDLLIKEQMIELKRTPKGTSLMIKNYDSYQTNGTTIGTGLDVGTRGPEGDKGTTIGTTSEIGKKGTTFGTTFGTSSDLGIGRFESNKGTTIGTANGTLLISLNKSLIKGEGQQNSRNRQPETPEQAERRRQRNAEFLRLADEMRLKEVGSND